MRKYFPHLIQQLTAPPANLNSNYLSLSRIMNKRKYLKECKKILNFKNEEDICSQIAFAYNGLKEAIVKRDEAMALRYLSIELFDLFKSHPQNFIISKDISSMEILDCIKVKNQKTGIQWFQFLAIFKHFDSQHLYGLERRIYIQNYQFQQTFPRKWCFNRFPLKNQIPKEKVKSQN